MEKNGLLAVVKFIYVAAIVCMHYGVSSSHSLYFMEGAYIFVDFFFLINGFFIMNHIMAGPHKDNRNVLKDTYYYIGRKLKKFYPHIFASTLALLGLKAIQYNWHISDIAKNTAYGLGDFFLLQGAFAGGGIPFLNGSLWYLSTLLILDYIIYYLLRKHRETMVFLCPVLAILLYSTIIRNYGNVDVWWSQIPGGGG